ncbi:MAG: hypothetical protein IKU51_04410 [Clostridia bacterium]|nr:hypothetical protein [Clostridia bacterium]
MTKKKFSCLCLAVLLLLPIMVTGCSPKVQSTIAPFNEEYGSERYDYFDSAIAYNDNFQLWWDDSSQCAILWDVNTGIFHSTTPYDFYSTNGETESYAALQLNTPLIVGYVDEDKNNYHEVSAYGTSTNEVGITSKAIENGVSVKYSFPRVEIAVTVEYLLQEDGLQIRIPMAGLEENSNRIYEIMVAPNMVAAVNDNDSYVMVPSGGGALIDAKTMNKPVQYSEAVYGDDPAEPLTMKKRNQRKINLPVFGVKDGDTGMLAIIEDGKDCARINARIGDSGTGYSTAYASFRIRGMEEIVYSSMGNHEMAATKYSNSVADTEYLSVEYIPLSEDNTYMGMASRYRTYLQEHGYLTETVQSVPALSVSFLGSTQTRKSFFGMPYTSDEVTTTITQTQAISAELKELIDGDEMLVSLLGYGEGGLASTTVGGGFKNSAEIGSKKEWAQFVDYAKENNMILAMDYDLVFYQNNSKGFRVNDTAAHTISSLKARIRPYVLNTAVEDETGEFFYFLSRGQLGKAVESAIAAAKNSNFDAVSLSTLTSVAYSDYRDVRYTAKSHTAEDVAAMLQSCTDNGLKVVATDANDYAALYADYVVETPLYSSKFNTLSQEIPFYSLVFQGYKALTSPSINTAINVNDAYLQAVATGMTLQFTLSDTLHDAIRYEEDTAYISSLYSDWKEEIADMVQRSKELHDQVGNQEITQYYKADGMSYTCFANGVEVYVNYTDAEMDSPMGTIPANDFVYG